MHVDLKIMALRGPDLQKRLRPGLPLHVWRVAECCAQSSQLYYHASATSKQISSGSVAMVVSRRMLPRVRISVMQGRSAALLQGWLTLI